MIALALVNKNVLYLASKMHSTFTSTLQFFYKSMIGEKTSFNTMPIWHTLLRFQWNSPGKSKPHIWASPTEVGTVHVEWVDMETQHTIKPALLQVHDRWRKQSIQSVLWSSGLCLGLPMRAGTRKVKSI